MRARIQQIMDSEGLTPSAFADKLGIGRAVMSHILNGRNNPSLDVVTRILVKFNRINSDWILSGEGNMYKDDFSTIDTDMKLDMGGNTDLFSQADMPAIDEHRVESTQPRPNVVNSPDISTEFKYRKENRVEEAQYPIQTSVNKDVTAVNTPPRKVSKIIVFYDDNTFETFETGKLP